MAKHGYTQEQVDALAQFVWDSHRMSAHRFFEAHPEFLEKFKNVSAISNPLVLDDRECDWAKFYSAFGQYISRLFSVEVSQETIEEEDEKAAAEPHLPEVTPKTVWQHTNGTHYVVELIANNQGDDPSKREKYPPMVIYRTLRSDKFWARRLDDWHRSMTPISGRLYEDEPLINRTQFLIDFVRLTVTSFRARYGEPAKKFAYLVSYGASEETIQHFLETYTE